MTRKLDVAFLRPETHATDLAFKLVTKEPLVLVVPSDHEGRAMGTSDQIDLKLEGF